jgi:hypothetical protein
MSQCFSSFSRLLPQLGMLLWGTQMGACLRIAPHYHPECLQRGQEVSALASQLPSGMLLSQADRLGEGQRPY